MNSGVPFLFYYIGLLFSVILFSDFFLKKYIQFVKKYGLINTSNSRSSDNGKILTGIGVIYSVVLLIYTVSLENLDFVNFKKISPEIGTSILIALFGVYRDILNSSRFQKYITLTFLLSMLVYSSIVDGSTIRNLNGFLGFYEINKLWSCILTFSIYITLINAVNRMDHINGYLTFFSIYFFSSMIYAYHLSEFYTLNSISIIIIGISLLCLWAYFSNNVKMYVGDSGSFFIGFWIAYFIIEYIVNYPGSTNYFNIKLENFPVIAIALLSMPILDLVRVVFLRIINLQSPFSKDKRWHLHHILLDKGMSHNKISLFLTFVSCFNCVVIFLLEPNFNSIELTMILFVIGFFWLSIFEYIRRFKNFIP